MTPSMLLALLLLSVIGVLHKNGVHSIRRGMFMNTYDNIATHSTHAENFALLIMESNDMHITRMIVVHTQTHCE